MKFQQKLDAIVKGNNSLLCIGLDSDFEKLPKHIQALKNPQYEFNKAIIDATHDLICAYKPNSAFYEGNGAEGIEQLKKTCDYIRTKYPEIVIIIDAKRGDIGSTNEGYARYIFNYLQADALTVQPYLGGESLKPLLDLKEKGLIILCRTSNPGAGEFQDLLIDGEPLYMHVARKAVNEWNANNNCLLVIGATYPKELAEVRKIAGDMTFLVPGIGVQGGNIEKTVKAGLHSQKAGMIINASRSIIFASKTEDFAERAREEAILLSNQINRHRI